MLEINRDELKLRLRTIQENGYKVPLEEDIFELALVMMGYLGDTEGELRDDLIYSILSNWITSGVLNQEQLKQLLQISLDDRHLFSRIGETNTDSVFMRTFSALIVAVIVYWHRQNRFLTNEEVKRVKDKMALYMSEEKDVRGFVADGGWAHSAAHGADALDELSLCEELGAQDLLDILQVIREKVCIDYHAYICYEDERLAYATNSLISRDLLKEEQLVLWVRSFTELNHKTELPRHFYLISNMRNYLNSLYYRLPENQYPLVKAAISETVLNIRRF